MQEEQITTEKPQRTFAGRLLQILFWIAIAMFGITVIVGFYRFFN